MLEDQQIKLGCVQPGEVSGTLGNALRKLADRATYLYVVGSCCWHSTQPSVNRLADGRSERYHPEIVAEPIRQRVKVRPGRGAILRRSIRARRASARSWTSRRLSW